MVKPEHRNELRSVLVAVAELSAERFSGKQTFSEFHFKCGIISDSPSYLAQFLVSEGCLAAGLDQLVADVVGFPVVSASHSVSERKTTMSTWAEKQD